MENPVNVLKRDEPGQNRFLHMAEFYQKCDEKYEANYQTLKDSIEKQANSPILDRHNQFMNVVKMPKATLGKIIEVSERTGAILQQSKYEYDENKNELYFYHSFYILDYFKRISVSNQVNDEKKNRREMIESMIFVNFLKNLGHQLVFDIFMGWAAYFSQLFMIPSSNITEKDIFLFREAGGTKSGYFEILKQVTLCFSVLVSVNSMNIIQFVRLLPEQEPVYQEIKNSYKNIINLDIEQQDYYWHFVDMFFKHCSKQINHTSIIMLCNFLEISYIQMKTAANQFTKNSQQIVKQTLCIDQKQYFSLFEFIHDKVLPKFERELQSLKSDSSQNKFYHLIQIPGSTTQILLNMLKKTIKRMDDYSTNKLFQNEIIDENNQEQLESLGLKQTESENPFYFIKLK